MEPSDTKLYKRTKKQIYKRIPKHSAYRSGILVQTYKKKFKSKQQNRMKHFFSLSQLTFLFHLFSTF